MTRASSILRNALKFRLWDGVFTKTMDTLTGGPFLAGLALALGATDFQIGLIAAIPFLAKVMYIPAVGVLERWGSRKGMCVWSSVFSRPMWLLAGLAALLLVKDVALNVLIVMVLLFSLGATFTGLAWNSWMKDLVPERIRGRTFSGRLALMGFVGMVVSLVGAVVVDRWTLVAGNDVVPLASLVLFGAAAGLIGIFFLNRIPEPQPLQVQSHDLIRALLMPLKDQPFRRLLAFTGTWAFATNLAVPFITVYMLRSLELSFSWVMAFTVASQLANMLFMRLWGRLADRFGSKAILVVCAPVFSLTLLMWTFTIKDNLWISLALIALIHIMNGLATAGIDVAQSNLMYQLAPSHRPTPYLATSALTTSVAAGVAPILGGVLGNVFHGQALSIQLNWEQLANNELFSVTAIRFAHLDFLFLIAFVLGVVALNMLPLIHERKQTLRYDQVVKSVKQEIQSIGTMRGLRFLTQTASFFAGVLLESGAWVSPKEKPKQEFDKDMFEDD